MLEISRSPLSVIFNLNDLLFTFIYFELFYPFFFVFFWHLCLFYFYYIYVVLFNVSVCTHSWGREGGCREGTKHVTLKEVRHQSHFQLVIYSFRRLATDAPTTHGSARESNNHFQDRQELRVQSSCCGPGLGDLCRGLCLAKHANNWCFVDSKSPSLAPLHNSLLHQVTLCSRQRCHCTAYTQLL
jgi:hypothetical protein